VKFAILSDSHKKTKLTKDAIEYLKKLGATIIIHAGDLVIKENLEVLKNSGLIYTSVFGNNDTNLLQYQNDYNIHKEPYYFKVKEIKFKLMHLPYYMTPDTNVVIFGHTHQFEVKYENNTLFLNPGEVCARNKPLSECTMLEIKEDKYIIDYYFKSIQEKDWDTKRYEFKK